MPFEGLQAVLEKADDELDPVVKQTKAANGLLDLLNGRDPTVTLLIDRIIDGARVLWKPGKGIGRENLSTANIEGLDERAHQDDCPTAPNSGFEKMPGDTPCFNRANCFFYQIELTLGQKRRWARQGIDLPPPLLQVVVTGAAEGVLRCLAAKIQVIRDRALDQVDIGFAINVGGWVSHDALLSAQSVSAMGHARA